MFLKSGLLYLTSLRFVAVESELFESHNIVKFWKHVMNWLSFRGRDEGVKRLIVVACQFAPPPPPQMLDTVPAKCKRLKMKSNPVFLFIVVYFELKIANLKRLHLCPHSFPSPDPFL